MKDVPFSKKYISGNACPGKTWWYHYIGMKNGQTAPACGSFSGWKAWIYAAFEWTVQYRMEGRWYAVKESITGKEDDDRFLILAGNQMYFWESMIWESLETVEAFQFLLRQQIIHVTRIYQPLMEQGIWNNGNVPRMKTIVFTHRDCATRDLAFNRKAAGICLAELRKTICTTM